MNACPRCGAPMTISYRVITRGDGSPDLGSARRVDSKGSACRSCILTTVKLARSPERVAAKTAARAAARQARRRLGGSGAVRSTNDEVTA